MKRDLFGDLAIAFGLGVLVGAALKGSREALKEGPPSPIFLSGINGLNALFVPAARGGAESPPTLITSTSRGFSSSPSRSAAAPQRALASVALPFDWIIDDTPLDLWSPR